jgi:hypothetical protein
VKDLMTEKIGELVFIAIPREKSSDREEICP